ncbi:transporter [Photobacterium rosenbergii]|uniref:Transporter n=1 Tax=Photobacterium rosenbergii TaxID=294936 RepID=A0A2T3NMV7_9GAMM|nr:ABC transporter permease subunit [Photobacterium rosenbergii]PSW16830.1 transporter [Photobacterium rosenbergii]
MLNRSLPWLSRAGALSAMVVLVGLLPDIAGIDPTQAILRARSGQQRMMTPEALEAVRQDLGLHRTSLERLWDWLTSLFQGDLGVSWIDGSPVSQSIMSAAGTSLLLMACAFGLTLLFCGISVQHTMWQWRRNRLDKLNGSISTVLITLPEYVIATLLILFFAIWLNLLPPYGWQGWQNIWLPSLALALPATGLFTKLLNDSLQRVLDEPWVITWLSANISSVHIGRYALRRAISNLLPQIAMIVIGLTGGAVTVEHIFSIPGIGRLTLGATAAQDLPTLQGGLLFLLVMSIAISSLTILFQHLWLGQGLKSGKLITSNPPLGFTKNRTKRIVSASIFLLLVGFALWAEMRDPYTSQFSRLLSPSLAAPLGADAVGRDLLARVGQGMLSTLSMGVLATILSLLVGLIMGFNTKLSQGLIEVTKGTPYIVAGLLVAGLSGMNPNSALIAVVLVSWAPLASHCSSLLLEARAQPHIRLAPLWGVGRWRMLRHYQLPYILPPLLRHTVMRFPPITLSLTALSFIGLGAKPPHPEWGLLIAESLPYIERAPQAVLAPILGLVLVSIAINLLFEDQQEK